MKWDFLLQEGKKMGRYECGMDDVFEATKLPITKTHTTHPHLFAGGISCWNVTIAIHSLPQFPLSACIGV